jgi:hypothetical protein
VVDAREDLVAAEFHVLFPAAAARFAGPCLVHLPHFAPRPGPGHSLEDLPEAVVRQLVFQAALAARR